MRTTATIAGLILLVATAATAAAPASASASASVTIISPETIRLGATADSKGLTVDTDRAAGFLSVGRWVAGGDPATVRVPAAGKPIGGFDRRVIETAAQGNEDPHPLVIFYHHY